MMASIQHLFSLQWKKERIWSDIPHNWDTSRGIQSAMSVEPWVLSAQLIRAASNISLLSRGEHQQSAHRTGADPSYIRPNGRQ